MKRLRVFESLTGSEKAQMATRNLEIIGVDTETSLEKLQKMLEQFGDLHVLDTQFIMQKTIIAAFYDIRNSKSAFNFFSTFYSVRYLPDPPFEEFSDILILFAEPSCVGLFNELANENSSVLSSTLNSVTFQYFDLRDIWDLQMFLYSLNKKTCKSVKTIEEFSDEKENIRPSILKKPENLTRFVISLESIRLGFDSRTTLMVKNIPNKYTQAMLLDSINRNHAYTFDFMYLPIDFKNRCNVGYAFINFINFSYIPYFYKEFDGKKWEKFNSEKICALSYARIQGRISLEKHFQSSSIMIQEKNMRPVMFSNK